MDKLINRIYGFIRENELIEKGDSVVVGLSGGADSVSLLYILKELEKLLDIKLYAVHVNHQLRGEESDRDEEFCRQTAKGAGIEFYSVHVDVRNKVRETGMSEEEAARILRYDAFEDVINKYLRKGGTAHKDHSIKIAVAHHADDQAETILFNMLRGSGLKGLGGMRPARGSIIRPLLEVSRKELMGYLEKRDLEFVTDSTNLENDHTRNRIRNIIMPLLNEHVNERASGHIAAVGNKIYAADQYLEDEARKYLEDIGTGNADACMSGENNTDNKRKEIRLGQTGLKERAQIFRIYVIIEALKMLEVPLKDWTDKHFHDIDKLLFMGKGSHIDLPGAVSAENVYKETLIIKHLQL